MNALGPRTFLAMPTKEQLRESLRASGAITQIVDDAILKGVPWIFDGNAAAFRIWRERVARAALLSPSALFIVGSAAFGYSLHPDKLGREFRRPGNIDGPSDIDIAIVDAGVFTAIWDSVVTLDRGRGLGPVIRAFGGSRSVGEWILQTRKNVYWGHISASLSSSGTELSARIRAMLAEASRLPPLEGHPSRARLYRTRDDFRHYHLNSLRGLSRPPRP